MIKKDYESNNTFLKYGYYNFEDVINKSACVDFNNYLKKNYKVSKNIFLSEKEYLRKNKIYERQGHSNVLDNYNTDFLFKNENFSEKLQTILGKNYYLYAKRVICSVPKSLYPNWIDKYLPKNIPNLTPYLKTHYRELRFFRGANFHQDMMDHPRHKANFLTVYIYLDKVSNNMSPLILLPKTHQTGPEKYPHNLNVTKKKFKLISNRGQKIEGQPIKITGNAGTTWGWHTCLLHGTIPNKNIKPRYSIRLIYRQTKNQSSLIKSVNNKLPSLIAPLNMY